MILREWKTAMSDDTATIESLRKQVKIYDKNYNETLQAILTALLLLERNDPDGVRYVLTQALPRSVRETITGQTDDDAT